MVGSRLVRLSPVLLPARSRRYVVAPHARIPSLLSSHGRDTQIIDDPATGVGTLINKSLEATIIVHPRDRVEKGICSPGKLQPATGKGGLRCLVLTFWNRARDEMET